MEFRKAVHADLPRIVEIYNQIIPSRLATADLEPVTVADREAWFASFTVTHPLWVMTILWPSRLRTHGRDQYLH